MPGRYDLFRRIAHVDALDHEAEHFAAIVHTGEAGAGAAGYGYRRKLAVLA